MSYAFKSTSPWVVVGRQPLTPDELVENKYFKVDPISGALAISHTDEQYPKGYKTWAATTEDCVGLECAAVWDPCHIESRLLDHFENRPNKWVQSLALKLQ